MKKLTLLAGLIAFSVSSFAIDINVTPEDDVKSAIQGAGEGDVIILADGDYGSSSSETKVSITVSVTIKAANAGKASLTKYTFDVPADAVVNSLVFDGLSANYDPSVDSKYFCTVNTATSTAKSVTIQNCYISDYSRGALRATTAGAVLEDIVIDNCIFENVSSYDATYAVINPQKVNLKSVLIKNSTFYRCPGSIFRNSEQTTACTFTVENCTVLECLGTGTGKAASNKMIQITNPTAASIKNSIFSGSFDATPIAGKPIDLVNAEIGTIDNCILEGFTDDPLYTNATVTNPLNAVVVSFDYAKLQLITNPATSGVGDPRWSAGDNAIGATAASLQPLSVSYYNLLGARVSENAKGLLITKTVYSDGSVKTGKALK